MNKKILILTVVYFNIDIIKKHIDFLTTVSDRADIIVLENPSKSTTYIKKYCLDLVDKSIIKQYCLFEENICGGVFKEAYKNIDLTNYDYIMVTDGDLTVPTTNDWLNEQIKIINKYPDTFTCAVDLLLYNLPVKEYPGCEGWHPKPYKVLSDCTEGSTGVHLLLFKKDRFQLLMNNICENNKVFIDSTLREYCLEKNLKWRRTKRNKAYHHTWDIYKHLNHPYTVMKTETDRNDLWSINKCANYINYDLNLLDKINRSVLVKSKNISTVIILTYNHQDYLQEAVESVLMQKSKYKFNIIIGDDASTDQTGSIAENFSRLNDNIIYYRNTKNLGVTKNLQKAFSLCDCEFVSFCEGDDYWVDEKKLEKQIDFLKQNLDCSGCFHHFIIHDQNTNEKATLRIPPHRTTKYNTVSIIENIIPSNFTTTMYRKSALDQIDSKIFNIFSVDWAFNIAVSEFGLLANTDEYMSVYRTHDNGVWSSNNDKKTSLKTSIVEYNDFFNDKYKDSFNKLDVIIEDTFKKSKHTKTPIVRKIISNKRGHIKTQLIRNKKKRKKKVIKKLEQKKLQHNSRPSKNLLERKAKVLTNMRKISRKKPNIITINNNINTTYKESNKLHIGCGDNYFDNNWLNVDLLNVNPPNVNYLSLNVLESFPFRDIELIHSEHFIEHLTKEEGVAFTRNCYNSLKSGGVLRISTFDLDALVDNCHSMNDQWKESCETKRLNLDSATRGEFLNMAFSSWGHKFAYNREDLEDIFRKGGFKTINVCKINQSDYEELRNREIRFNSELIIEGIK